MKKLERDFIIAWIVGMVLPGLILYMMVGRKAMEEQQRNEYTETYHDAAQVIPVVPSQITLSVLSRDGSYRTMELENYLTGVVLAEMPVSFEFEALKAQCVVARTYALRRLELPGKHDIATICTDPVCCQGYISPEEFLSRGGSESGIFKVSNAVLETAGEVLVYHGSLIDATYFSCSGGMTEDAAAVWGMDVPYLQATHSPGEEAADHYEDIRVLTVSEVENALGMELQGSPDEWFAVLSHTDGGGVDEVSVCGKMYTGVELRRLLSLRSTVFQVEAADDRIAFHTRGYGHRVGMSQYGADAMAAGGSTYDRILAHYFTGTTLEQYHRDN